MSDIEFKTLNYSVPHFSVFDMTPDEQAEYSKDVEEFEQQEDERHAMHNFFICGAEKELLKKVDFKNYVVLNGNPRQTALKNMALGVVDVIRHGGSRNFVLLGEAGVGKTFTSLCVLKEVCRMTYTEKIEESSPVMKIKNPYYEEKRWYTGRYLTSNDLNWKMFDAEDYNSSVTREGILKTYVYAKLLIVDEIGRTNNKKERDNLFDIIDKRYQKGLSTIFISNLSRDELEKNLGAALSGRIFSNALLWTSDGQAPNMRADRQAYC